MKTGREYLKDDDDDDADMRTTRGGCLARTEVLEPLKPGSESGLSLTTTYPTVQHSMSLIQGVVGTLSTSYGDKSDIVDQSAGAVIINPDNPIVSLDELDELEMRVCSMQLSD